MDDILNIILKFFDPIVPHFFEKENIIPIRHPKLIKAIAEIKNCSSQLDAVHEALEILSKKYISKRFESLLLFWLWFEKDPNELWNREGFMHCTQQNFLLRILLVESGWFKEKEIKLGYSLIWYFFLHQYLKVKMEDNWIALDPWNYLRGAEIGKYAAGFGMKKLR